jgi:hypothetical protein
MISTDPEIDPRKCVVGIACAAQAVQDGHRVNVFFASHAVRLLQTNYITNIDGKVGEAPAAKVFRVPEDLSSRSSSCSLFWR